MHREKSQDAEFAGKRMRYEATTNLESHPISLTVLLLSIKEMILSLNCEIVRLKQKLTEQCQRLAALVV